MTSHLPRSAFEWQIPRSLGGESKSIPCQERLWLWDYGGFGTLSILAVFQTCSRASKTVWRRPRSGVMRWGPPSSASISRSGWASRTVEKFYLAGLLHDIGIFVNSLLFEKEFKHVLKLAESSETPLCEVEQRVLGFTHCDSGRILADTWLFPADIAETIEFHHHPLPGNPSAEMTCTINLADLLCRLRGLGYGYYEAREFDLAAEPSWHVLQHKYPRAAELDLARFTFELDEHAIQVQALVDSIFAKNGTTH